jgi:hypothetical protein
MPPGAFKDAIIRDVKSHDRAATVIDKLHISWIIKSGEC